jgi:hypothetical protein
MYTALTVVVAAPVKETVLRLITCPTSNSGMGMFAQIGLKFFVHDRMKRQTISKVRALVVHDVGRHWERRVVFHCTQSAQVGACLPTPISAPSTVH